MVLEYETKKALGFTQRLPTSNPNPQTNHPSQTSGPSYSQAGKNVQRLHGIRNESRLWGGPSLTVLFHSIPLDQLSCSIQTQLFFCLLGGTVYTCLC